MAVTTLTNEALTQRIMGLEREIELRARAAESALAAADAANEYRLETMNNFRADLEKQARNFMTKDDYSNQHKALEDRIDAYERSVSERLKLLEQQSYELKGRQGLSTPLIVVMAGSVGAILGFLIQLLYRTMSHMGGVGRIKVWPFSNNLTDPLIKILISIISETKKLEDFMSALSDKMNTMNAKIDHLLDMAVAQQKQINDLMADKADIDAVMASMDTEITKIDGVLNPPPPPEG